MRKVIFGINMTLDGCVDHTKGNSADGEMHEYYAALIRDADMLAYGRKTYELMVPYWPDVAKNHSGETKELNDFAEAFDAVNEIVVFSRSLEGAEGKNTRIVRTDPADEIRRLKQEEGKSILLGGVAVPSQLIAQGLVDEYRIVVHPVIAGEGRRLMEGINLAETLKLKLVETKTFKSGSIALRYVKQ